MGKMYVKLKKIKWKVVKIKSHQSPKSIERFDKWTAKSAQRLPEHVDCIHTIKNKYFIYNHSDIFIFFFYFKRVWKTTRAEEKPASSSRRGRQRQTKNSRNFLKSNRSHHLHTGGANLPWDHAAGHKANVKWGEALRQQKQATSRHAVCSELKKHSWRDPVGAKNVNLGQTS